MKLRIMACAPLKRIPLLSPVKSEPKATSGWSPCISLYQTRESTFVLTAVVVHGHKGVTVTRRLWVRVVLEWMNYYFLIFSFLSSDTKVKTGFCASATQHTMPRKKSIKSGERSFLTWLFAGYTVKMRARKDSQWPPVSCAWRMGCFSPLNGW